MGVLALSAAVFTSCDDFFETSSKVTLNTETAYSNLESAEMALVGCYDGWQRTVSDEGVGMYLVAEFASEQAFAGLGLSDAKNNNVIDQFDLGIAPSYNDLFNTGLDKLLQGDIPLQPTYHAGGQHRLGWRHRCARTCHR